MFAVTRTDLHTGEQRTQGTFRRAKHAEELAARQNELARKFGRFEVLYRAVWTEAR